MTEIFKPRSNMVYQGSHWECLDENGNLVCDGGPSIIWSRGSWDFYDDHNGGYHRLDGPATSLGEWFILDRDVTKEIEKFAEENDLDLDNLSDEDKVLIALKFG